MKAGIDDPVGLAEQFLARITRNRAKFVVGVGNDTPGVGDGDDGVFVQRDLEVPDLAQGGAQIRLGAALPRDIGAYAAPQDGSVDEALRPRAKPHPARLRAVRVMERDLDEEIRQLAGAALFLLQQLAAVLQRDLAVKGVRVGEDVRQRDAVERFYAGAEIEEAPRSVGRAGEAVDGVARQIVAQRAQGLLAGAQRVLGALARGDILRSDDDPADFAIDIAPGPDLPLDPLHGAVGPLERLAVRTFFSPRQAAPVDGLPLLADFGKHLVMTAPERRLCEAEIVAPAGAGDEVAHVAVEQRDGCGRMFDKFREHAVAAAQMRALCLAGGIVPGHPVSSNYVQPVGPTGRSCRNRRETAIGKNGPAPSNAWNGSGLARCAWRRVQPAMRRARSMADRP